jgi:hypothetical protein
MKKRLFSIDINALRAKQQTKKHLFSIDMNALTGKTPTLTREGLYVNRKRHAPSCILARRQGFHQAGKTDLQ